MGARTITVRNTPMRGRRGTSAQPQKKKTDKLEDDYGHDRFDAITVAKKVIENQLKSPSTAEFCKSADFTVKCSGSTWTVSGYVDAQNGFGATIRSSFTVTFAFSGSGQYTVGSCVIE